MLFSQMHRQTCWTIVQPGGMRNKPSPKILKEFLNQCESLEANVISSMLFYYMVDAEASYQTRLRAVYSAESLVKRYENYYTFFKQNEHNLEAIDVDLMSSEHAGAGRELVKVLKNMKTTLEKDFGFKKQKKRINVLKMQEGIEAEKKINAFDILGGGGKSNPPKAQEEDLLGVGGIGNVVEDQPKTQKKNSFGFLGKKSSSTTPQEEDILGIGEPQQQEQEQQMNQEFNLLDLDMGGGEAQQPQTQSNDLMGLNIGQEAQVEDTGFDLLGGSITSKPAKKKKADPFGFI